jgi:hypothetical protein
LFCNTSVRMRCPIASSWSSCPLCHSLRREETLFDQPRAEIDAEGVVDAQDDYSDATDRRAAAEKGPSSESASSGRAFLGFDVEDPAGLGLEDAEKAPGLGVGEQFLLLGG